MTEAAFTDAARTTKTLTIELRGHVCSFDSSSSPRLRHYVRSRTLPSPGDGDGDMADIAMSSAKLPLSCYQCRSRKVRCDKTLPACKRCTSSQVSCTYPDARKKPVIVATRPRVKELEARLKQLEHRLGNEAAANEPSPSASSASSDSLFATGRFEQLPPQSVVEELVDIFFAKVYRDAPFLHPERYRNSLYLPPHMQPPMCLQYAVLAAAALASSPHISLAEAFYRRARQYAEADELRGDGQDFLTVAHAQSWALITRFEAMVMWFTRTNMSCARAVRLAQMLGLDKLDGRSGVGQPLPPPRDWTEAEERRRTFWVIFNDDRTSSGTTEWPVLINSQIIHTRLPASEAAFLSGIEETTKTMKYARHKGMIGLSTFAWRTMAVQFFQEAAELNSANFMDPDMDETEYTSFWSRYLDLENHLSNALSTLPDLLRGLKESDDPDAVFVTCVLHTSTICLHNAGKARVKVSRAQDTFLRTETKVLPAAHEIFDILAALADIDLLFRSPFVAFASFMAAMVLLDDFAATQNPESDERLGILLNLMIAIGEHNPYTASLVVQLHHSLYKTGTDKLALEKVQHLLDKLDTGGSFLGNQDADTGGMVFCPLEHDKGPYAPEIKRFWADS
ncbi:Citrinin biosynthesis transcriptional activator ctnR [Paramyrothecium foliicola]|nr:Citrinin biosynthesis transcriptional activator ctnR [Paramyrothecium foliicola]